MSAAREIRQSTRIRRIIGSSKAWRRWSMASARRGIPTWRRNERGRPSGDDRLAADRRYDCLRLRSARSGDTADDQRIRQSNRLDVRCAWPGHLRREPARRIHLHLQRRHESPGHGDLPGNLTADGTRTFEWDAEDRLVAVDIGTHRSEFTYAEPYRDFQRAAV